MAAYGLDVDYALRAQGEGPYRALWAAVFAQTINDACDLREDALNYLFSETYARDRETICELADIDFGYWRRVAASAVLKSTDKILARRYINPKRESDESDEGYEARCQTAKERYVALKKRAREVASEHRVTALVREPAESPTIGQANRFFEMRLRAEVERRGLSHVVLVGK